MLSVRRCIFAQIYTMSIIRVSLVVLFGAFIVSCSNYSVEQSRKDGFTKVLKTKEDSLFSEVMEGHDIGMAKMSKINKYLAEIKTKLDSLVKLPASKVPQEYQQALIDLQEDLNYADYGMSTWMNEFKIDSAKGNEEARVKYLEAEKIKVEQVKKSILASLQRADSLFGKK